MSALPTMARQTTGRPHPGQHQGLPQQAGPLFQPQPDIPLFQSSPTMSHPDMSVPPPVPSSSQYIPDSYSQQTNRHVRPQPSNPHHTHQGPGHQKQHRQARPFLLPNPVQPEPGPDHARGQHRPGQHQVRQNAASFWQSDNDQLN